MNMNVRFNNVAAEALKKYLADKEDKVIRLKVIGRG
jgi:hypothetical protein